MKTITINLYELDELDTKAKEFALHSNADINVSDEWWKLTLCWFQELLKILGIEVEYKHIYFSGFYAQGDGSGFEGKMDIQATMNAIPEKYWRSMLGPEDQLKLSLCPADRRVWRLITEGIIDVTVEVKTSRHYHKVLPAIDFIFRKGKRSAYKQISSELDKVEHWIEQTLKALNQLLYESLRKEYEYLTSDPAIEATLISNQAEFMPDGRSADWLNRYTY